MVFIVAYTFTVSRDFALGYLRYIYYRLGFSNFIVDQQNKDSCHRRPATRID